MEVSEVIKSLRYCSVKGNSCLRCPCYKQDSGCLARLHAEAANQLESQEKRIAELEAQNRWIPVTERLPKKWFHQGDDEHLGEPIDFNVFIRGALIPTSLWFNGESFVDKDGTLYDVTHWRYLPEPPKEVV